MTAHELAYESLTVQMWLMNASLRTGRSGQFEHSSRQLDHTHSGNATLTPDDCVVDREITIDRSSTKIVQPPRNAWIPVVACERRTPPSPHSGRLRFTGVPTQLIREHLLYARHRRFVARSEQPSQLIESQCPCARGGCQGGPRALTHARVRTCCCIRADTGMDEYTPV